MKKDKDKELDDLFKSRLDDPDYNTGHLEDDWSALEQMLDKPAKRPGIIFWLPILSSAAALLIFFGWLLFKPQTVPHKQQKQQASVIHNHNNTTVNKIAVNSGAGNKISGKLSPVLSANKSVKGHNNATVNAGNSPKKELAVNYVNNNNTKHNPTVISSVRNKSMADVNAPGVQEVNNPIAVVHNDIRTSVILAAVNTDLLKDGISGSDEYTALTPVESRDVVGNLYKPDPIKNEKNITKLGFVKRPQLALTFIGASELNGANSFGDAKSGTNLGLLFSAGVFNKLTISTGANYSVKPYNTDIANYHTTYKFKTNPSQIEADCRVLDIPLNVDYQLYNKHKNKFSIGTGLSSYIMLHESYQYYYTDPNTKGPAAYTVPNSGKYFFGIMNLQATYQRQVNSKVGLSIRPYMKLPLTNIGYSQVRLQTAGVAIGLNWNLNSLTKP